MLNQWSKMKKCQRSNKCQSDYFFTLFLFSVNFSILTKKDSIFIWHSMLTEPKKKHIYIRNEKIYEELFFFYFITMWGKGQKFVFPIWMKTRNEKLSICVQINECLFCSERIHVWLNKENTKTMKIWRRSESKNEKSSLFTEEKFCLAFQSTFLSLMKILDVMRDLIVQMLRKKNIWKEKNVHCPIFDL